MGDGLKKASSFNCRARNTTRSMAVTKSNGRRLRLAGGTKIETHPDCRAWKYWQANLRIVRESLPDATIMVFRHEPTTDIPEMANLVTSSMDDVRSFAPKLQFSLTQHPFHLGIAKALQRWAVICSSKNRLLISQMA